jgi:hypothetical protein
MVIMSFIVLLRNKASTLHKTVGIPLRWIFIGQINTGCECKEELPGELSVGYYISKDKLNKGYATEAVKAITQHFFPINPNDFYYAIWKDNGGQVI